MRELIEHLPLVPKTCTWELTLRCNMRCGHCGSSAGHARGEEMSREEALRVTGELAALGCGKVTLSGGEPTLAGYWADVASEGTRLGMRMNMIVNASQHDRAFVRRARDAGVVALGVSLDGLEPTHDGIRGVPGMFGKAMRLLEECAAERMPTVVVTTLWKGNLHELEAISDVVSERAKRWQIQLGIAMGNLAQIDQLRPEDLLTAVPSIAGLVERSRIPIDVGDNIGYFGPYEDSLRHREGTAPCWVGCFGGCRHMGIQADGGVKGCLAMQAQRATEGNLRREPLADIWRRPGAFAYNRDFKVDDLGGFCRTCEYANICRGGCFATRVSQGGENRFCYHRVATLAAQQQVPKRTGSSSRAYVPAALGALLSLAGCSDPPTPPNTDAYGIQMTDAYGIRMTDAYGIDFRSPDLPDPGELPDADTVDADHSDGGASED